MAKLYITEYADLRYMSGLEPAIATQLVDFTAGVTASAEFNAETRFVRLHTDALASIVFGISPVATTSHPRMAAGQTEYFAVNAPINSAKLKVSAIVNT